MRQRGRLLFKDKTLRFCIKVAEKYLGKILFQLGDLSLHRRVRLFFRARRRCSWLLFQQIKNGIQLILRFLVQFFLLLLHRRDGLLERRGLWRCDILSDFIRVLCSEPRDPPFLTSVINRHVLLCINMQQRCTLVAW